MYSSRPKESTNTLLRQKKYFTKSRRLSPKRRSQNLSTPTYINVFNFRSQISGIYSLIEPFCITESQKIQQIYSLGKKIVFLLVLDKARNRGL